MKNALRKVGTVARNRYAQAGAAFSLALVAGSASAETDPTQGAAAITAIETQAQEYIDAAWPVVILVTGALIGIGLFKRFARKSAS